MDLTHCVLDEDAATFAHFSLMGQPSSAPPIKTITASIAQICACTTLQALGFQALLGHAFQMRK
eukprot:2157832-Amphidinium_carterae.1